MPIVRGQHINSLTTWRPTYYFTSGGTGYVHVDDVVDALLQLAKSKLKNARYVLVAENLSYKTFLARLKQQNQLKSITKFVLLLPKCCGWQTLWQHFKVEKEVFPKGFAVLTTATADGTKISKALQGFVQTTRCRQFPQKITYFRSFTAAFFLWERLHQYHSFVEAVPAPFSVIFSPLGVWRSIVHWRLAGQRNVVFQ